MESFKDKIIHGVVEATTQRLDDLCNSWVRLFGHSYEDGIELQLERLVGEFLDNIISDTHNMITAATANIESK